MDYSNIAGDKDKQGPADRYRYGWENYKTGATSLKAPRFYYKRQCFMTETFF